MCIRDRKKTESGLSIPLLKRIEKTQTLKVNFGTETSEIMSEVRNLKRDYPERPVPQKAGEIFRRFEEYRKYNNSLEQMVFSMGARQGIFRNIEVVLNCEGGMSSSFCHF